MSRSYRWLYRCNRSFAGSGLSGVEVQKCHHARVDARINHEIKLDPSRPEYHRASLEWRSALGGGPGGEFVAESTGMQRSSRLLSMRAATVLPTLLRFYFSAQLMHWAFATGALTSSFTADHQPHFRIGRVVPASRPWSTSFWIRCASTSARSRHRSLGNRATCAGSAPRCVASVAELNHFTVGWL